MRFGIAKLFLMWLSGFSSFLLAATLMPSSATPLPDRFNITLTETGNPAWLDMCGKPGPAGGEEAYACELLADQHLNGNGVPVSRRMTAYYLLKACRYGDYEMCQYAFGMTDQLPENSDIAGEAALILCKATNPQACAVAAANYKRQDQPFYDPDRAIYALQSGCDQNEHLNCLLLADFLDGEEVPPDVTPDLNRALALNEGLCRAEPALEDDIRNYANACWRTHRMLSGDEGLENNQMLSSWALIRACEFDPGEFGSCDYAGASFYLGGNGVEKNERTAATMWVRSCEQGRQADCVNAGRAFAQWGDDETAYKLQSASCDETPSRDACGGAALSAAHHFGASHELTTKYSKIACDNDDGWACYQYASNTYYLGVVDPLNRFEFQKACNLGFAAGCEEVARQEYNDQVEASNKAARERLPSPNTQFVMPSLATASHNYWANWKPSYCKDYTRGGFTTKAECAD